MIDLERLEAAASATFEVEVESGDQPAGFLVLGSSSEAYAKAKREIEIADIKMLSSVKDRPDLTTDSGAEMAAVNESRRRMTVIRHCVVDWYGFGSGGKEIKFSAEALDRALRFAPHWVDLLIREIGNDRNFMKG